MESVLLIKVLNFFKERRNKYSHDNLTKPQKVVLNEQKSKKSFLHIAFFHLFNILRKIKTVIINAIVVSLRLGIGRRCSYKRIL